MNSAPPKRRHLGSEPSRRMVFWAIIAVPCLVEILLQATDTHLLGSPHMRTLAYHNGAFWTGLLDNLPSNYAMQPATMFLTYAFLHAGLVHLVGNMLVLILLERRILRLFTARFFLLIYVVSAIGGGAGFALLSSSPQPMVGASGAIFGLAGAILCSETRTQFRRTSVPLITAIAGLVVLNLLFWILEDGLLAWQAHLGGFITGWVIVILNERIKNN